MGIADLVPGVSGGTIAFILGIYEDFILNLSKISIIGVGMITTPGVTYRMFQALAKKKINIQVISTSEIKISVLINKKYTQKAVTILHKEFKLNN